MPEKQNNPSNPYESANPYDVVEELRFIVSDLKSVLYGNTNLRITGLLNDLDLLRKEVKNLRRDIIITWIILSTIFIIAVLAVREGWIL